MLGHVTSAMLFLSHYPPVCNDQIIFLHICARLLLLLSFPVHLLCIFFFLASYLVSWLINRLSGKVMLQGVSLWDQDMWSFNPNDFCCTGITCTRFLSMQCCVSRAPGSFQNLAQQQYCWYWPLCQWRWSSENKILMKSNWTATKQGNEDLNAFEEIRN